MGLLQMVVQYAPTGSMVYIPQHIAKGFASGDAALLEVSNQFGGSHAGGDGNAGSSFRGYDAKGNDGHLIWLHANGGAFFDVWQLRNNAAVETALVTIAESLANNEVFLVLSSAGEAVTGS